MTTDARAALVRERTRLRPPPRGSRLREERVRQLKKLSNTDHTRFDPRPRATMRYAVTHLRQRRAKTRSKARNGRSGRPYFDIVDLTDRHARPSDGRFLTHLDTRIRTTTANLATSTQAIAAVHATR
jgi:hypothetical protein